jgi:hypothetical protein
MLNACRKHDFQDAFKNDRSAWNSAYEWKGAISEGDGAKLGVYWMAAPVSEIMDSSGTCSCIHVVDVFNLF